MRFAAFQSVVCNREVGLSGFPLPCHLAVSDGKLGFFSRPPSPASLAQYGFILSYALRLYRVRPALRSALDFGFPKSRRLPWGCGPSSRHRPTASSLEHPIRSLPFRPRRFSRPRRLPPRLAWWAYFIPLPRPGFTLQGFDSSSAAVSPFGARCPLAVRPTSLQVVAYLLHSAGPRLQGFHPRKSP